jgi:hypothetical protein
MNNLMNGFPSPTQLVVKCEAKIAEDKEKAWQEAANFWQGFSTEMSCAAQRGESSISGYFPTKVDASIATSLLLSMNDKINGEPQKCEYTIEVDELGRFTVIWRTIPQCESTKVELPDSIF